MKVMVVGAGAVGGYYGALLHRAGNQVGFLARGDHHDRISRYGFEIRSVTSGKFTVFPEVFEHPTTANFADLVLFCVKSYDNINAIKAMAPAVRSVSTVITLQNGIGSGMDLSRSFGVGNILQGVTYVDATRTGPGVVEEYGGPCNIIFGEEDGSRSERADKIFDTISNAGISVELSSDINCSVWTKLLYICALSGMMCITDSSMEEVLDTPDTYLLTERVITEAYAVAKAQNINLQDNVVQHTMDRLLSAKGKVSSSMYTDLKRGNQLEVDVLNGAISRLGKELGVETPMNDFITTCLMLANKRGIANLQNKG